MNTPIKLYHCPHCDYEAGISHAVVRHMSKHAVNTENVTVKSSVKSSCHCGGSSEFEHHSEVSCYNSNAGDMRESSTG